MNHPLGGLWRCCQQPRIQRPARPLGGDDTLSVACTCRPNPNWPPHPPHTPLSPPPPTPAQRQAAHQRRVCRLKDGQVGRRRVPGAFCAARCALRGLRQQAMFGVCCCVLFGFANACSSSSSQPASSLACGTRHTPPPYENKTGDAGRAGQAAADDAGRV
jgi:hypothetical protein